MAAVPMPTAVKVSRDPDNLRRQLRDCCFPSGHTQGIPVAIRKPCGEVHHGRRPGQEGALGGNAAASGCGEVIDALEEFSCNPQTFGRAFSSLVSREGRPFVTLRFGWCRRKQQGQQQGSRENEGTYHGKVSGDEGAFGHHGAMRLPGRFCFQSQATPMASGSAGITAGFGAFTGLAMLDISRNYPSNNKTNREDEPTSWCPQIQLAGFPLIDRVRSGNS